MNKIAIIPARSGSKGLKDKNIKVLIDKPMIAYTIEAAISSNLFDCVHVSTDSEVYADIAKEYGAEVVFLRDQETSMDTSGSWDVVREVLRKYEKIGKTFDFIALLQPTSPLRTEAHIREAYHLFSEKDAKAVVSVCEMEHSPLWSNVISDDLSMDGFITENTNKQRQLLDKYYRINGAIYMLKKDIVDSINLLYKNGTYAYIMSREDSIDIDNELDFRLAEFMLQSK